MYNRVDYSRRAIVFFFMIEENKFDGRLDVESETTENGQE